MGLILNLQTGHVSPQFHCIYDNFFVTPKQDPKATSKWQELTDLHVQHDSCKPSQNLLPTFQPTKHPPTSESEGETDTNRFAKRNKKLQKELKHLSKVDSEEEPTEQDIARYKRRQDDDDDDEEDVASTRTNIAQQQQQPQLPPQPNPVPNPPAPEPIDQQQQRNNQGDNPENEGEPDPEQQEEIDDEIVEQQYEEPEEPQDSPFEPRRSRRQRQDVERYEPSMQGHTYARNRMFIVSYISEFVEYIAAASTLADPDTMTLKEALQEPDADKFIEAMEKEVEDHVKRGHWKLVTTAEMFAAGYKTKPIMLVWSMKRKRNPLGQIVKYKARLCAHGGQTQQGVHYDSTFAPVVTWTTIRYLLIQSLINGWHTRQVDFVLAYPQAKVSHDVYTILPEKFTVRNNKLVLDINSPSPWKQKHKLKLIQNLYGLRDAGATWFEHLKTGLLKRGFVQSEVDPCLFYKKNLILITYVDDCILMSPDKSLCDDFIASMKTEYKLEDEGDVTAYLGINVTRPSPDIIKLNQPAMIQRIIDFMKLTDDRMHQTPVDKVLHKDKNSPGQKSDFN